MGPFLLLAPLGSGGSGRVWAAVRLGQLGFTKRMALKVMRRDRLGSERARARFDREASLSAQLRHFNLRAVHELGRYEGRPYMAMAWVDTSLIELIEHAPQRRLETPIVCWIGVQVCAALSTAHGHIDPTGQPHPIMHGDVSPGNILLTKTGHVQLADLAADVNPSQDDRAAEPGSRQFFGSLSYASPEALKGLPRDGRSDLFSLGCVLYEALCGAAAFEGDDERSVMFQVLERPPVDLRERRPSVPEAVARVVRRAMQRRPEERFQNADEMRDALVRCVEDWSTFQLEMATTALIERVLGERIRAREEEMRLAYQLFSTAQLAKTDTLPVNSAARRDPRERTPAQESLTTTWREAPASRAGAASKLSGRALRAAGVLALMAVAFTSIVLSSKRDNARTTGLDTGSASNLDPHIATAEPRQLLRALPAPGTGPAAAAPGSLTPPDAGAPPRTIEAKTRKVDVASPNAAAQSTTDHAKPKASPRARSRGTPPATRPKAAVGDALVGAPSTRDVSSFKLPPPDPYQYVEPESPSAPAPAPPSSGPARRSAATRSVTSEIAEDAH